MNCLHSVFIGLVMFKLFFVYCFNKHCSSFYPFLLVIALSISLRFLITTLVSSTNFPEMRWDMQSSVVDETSTYLRLYTRNLITKMWHIDINETVFCSVSNQKSDRGCWKFLFGLILLYSSFYQNIITYLSDTRVNQTACG